MGFSQTYNVRVNTTYDMLSFTAASDYTAVISPDARTRDDFSAWLSRNVTFSSLYSNQTNTLYPVLSDDYIEKIVNKNGFVQIGSYVYKVDPTYSVTAVIHINNLNDVIQSEMIAHNYRNANIRLYSLVEEVVTMVESGINPSGRLFCGDGGVGTKEANKHIDLFPPSGGATCGWVDCWVKYLAAGIYFHMYARYNNTCSYRTIYIHKTPVSKIIKCGATSGPYINGIYPRAMF